MLPYGNVCDKRLSHKPREYVVCMNCSATYAGLHQAFPFPLLLRDCTQDCIALCASIRSPLFTFLLPSPSLTVSCCSTYFVSFLFQTSSPAPAKLTCKKLSSENERVFVHFPCFLLKPAKVTAYP